MYVYYFKSVGIYTFPYKDHPNSVQSGYTNARYTTETESAAIRGFYRKVQEHPSHMISHTRRKDELLALIKEKYLDEYPEAFL